MKILAIGCLLATSAVLATGTPSTEPDGQKPERNIGQLARYEGDWIINGDRRSVRVVTHRDANVIETFESECRDNFGCSYVRFLSMRMTFDPESGAYRGQVKWDGNSLEEHRQASWMPHALIGRWNDETKTMRWANSTAANHKFKQLEISTSFHDANKQTTSIYESIDGRRSQKLFGNTFTKLK